MKSIAILVLCLVVCVNSTPAQNREEQPASDIAGLEQRIAKVLANTRTPGAAVVIADRERVLWAAGIGKADLANGRPVTTDTRFRIGSITKGFVALSVMMLVEEGKLSLDDTLRQVAPDLEFHNPWESTNPVRLVHVMEHTAGWDMHSFVESAYNDPRPITLHDALSLRPATRTSRWEPGTGFAYSNIGAPVAAYIVEKLAGRRFEDFVAERIFRPLGMKSATFDAATDDAGRLATGYDPHIKPVAYRNILMRPAGAVSASADDMARYLRLYLNRGSLEGTELISPGSMERIERPESSLAARNGIRAGYGLYNHTREYRGFVFHGHTGGIDGYGAEMFYLPEAGLGYAFMINNFSGAPFYQIGQLLRAYITRDLPKPGLPASAPISAARLSGWAGYYEPQNPPIEFYRLISRITGIVDIQTGKSEGQLSVKPVLGGAGRALAAVDEVRFRPADRVLADTLFTLDKQGARLMVANGSVFRELPGWLVWARLVLAALCPALMITSMVLGLWWTLRALLRKVQMPRPALRMWPFVAALSFAGMLALSSVTGETAWRLGSLTVYSAGLFLLSLVLPAASVLGLLEGIRAARGHGPLGLTIYALTCSMAACLTSAYLAVHGFIGLRTWI